MELFAIKVLLGVIILALVIVGLVNLSSAQLAICLNVIVICTLIVVALGISLAIECLSLGCGDPAGCTENVTAVMLK